jgi:hypothetical protein
MISCYYNEIDPFCAQWLRNLISAGHICRTNGGIYPSGGRSHDHLADHYPEDSHAY